MQRASGWLRPAGELFGSLPAGAPPLVFVPRTFFDAPFDYVVSDDREAGRISTAHLLGFGHRRITAVGGLENLSCFQERHIGYREALEHAGVPFDDSLVLPCIPTREGGYEQAASIEALSPRPTAATCYNDSTALGLYFGLMAAGLVPGRDVAIVGNEDVAETRLVHPQLSVTTVSRDEMGRRAAELLVRRIGEPDAPQERVVLPTRLVVRGNSSPAPVP